MNKKLPQTVHFQLTSKCNNNCKHCFGPDKNTPDMSLSEIKKMLSIIISGGAKNIHLSGGEPLLKDHFDTIVELFKKHSLNIFLDTNGDFFFNYKKIISENIAVLGLPIDFANKSWRNSKNLENVSKVLKYYKSKKDKKLKIRILTTATLENINDLENIGKLIKEYPVDAWRIFQFLPLKGTSADRHKKEFWISQNKFQKATVPLKNKYSKYFDVNLVAVGQRNRAYFIIASNGDVMIPIESKKICINKIVGNIFDQGIIGKWDRFGSDINFNDSTAEIFKLIKKST